MALAHVSLDCFIRIYIVSMVSHTMVQIKVKRNYHSTRRLENIYFHTIYSPVSVAMKTANTNNKRQETKTLTRLMHMQDFQYFPDQDW